MNAIKLFFSNFTDYRNRLGHDLTIQDPDSVFKMLLKHSLSSLTLGVGLLYLDWHLAALLPQIKSQESVGVAVLFVLFICTLASFGVVFFVMTFAIFQEALLVKKNMSEEKCPEILLLCNEHPEIKAYRDEIIKQGRKFTESEYLSLRAYAEKKELQRQDSDHKSACKELYLS